ncbi:DUF3800 domain-containing protein [Calditrichota bacterium GD2]
MSSLQVTHVGFSDESNWNTGRFRSLGLVTCPIKYLDELQTQLQKLIQESGISEFKWKKLRGAKERFAANKICEFTIYNARIGKLRVDILIWDIEDSRHKIEKRDDIANLQRMYYKIFQNVFRKRWPNDSIWRLYPDEQTAIDWDTIKDYLKRASESIEIEQSLLTQGKILLSIKQEFGIEEILPVSSKEHSLVQLVDLFAGMAVFSYDKFDEYHIWLKNTSQQTSLFEEDSLKTSKGSIERFKVFNQLDRLCKKYRLGVSLRSRKGLWTANPANPINFWLYEPQHPKDKAPVKKN